ARGRRIGERRGRYRPLRDRQEGTVLGGEVGGEDRVELGGVDRDLHRPVGQRGGLDERPHREGGVAALEVVDRLAHVRDDTGDVHEAGYLVGVAGDGGHGAAGGRRSRPA